MYLEVTLGAVLRRPSMARNARIPHKLPSAHELSFPRGNGVLLTFLCLCKEKLQKKHTKGQTDLNFAYAKFRTRFPLWNPLSD